MSASKPPILVFATGQQRGSVAAALLKAGWPVRALARDAASPNAALREAGVDLVPGTFADPAVILAAMRGVHGVFSVQRSFPGGEVTDEDRVRYHGWCLALQQLVAS